MEQPVNPLDTLTDAQLQELGIRDLQRARTIFEILRGWGPHAEAFDQMLPHLLRAIKLSPDPDMALNNFERWQANLANRLPYYRFLAENPLVLEIFFTVCATSQFFSEILIQNPEYFEFFSDPSLRRRPKTASQHYRDLHNLLRTCTSYGMKIDALRRYKQREVLRIGVMDILAGTNAGANDYSPLPDLPEVAQALSDFADACVQVAYEIAHEELSRRYEMTGTPAFAVIGMGKLGGRELNYSSDIDLIFVHDDDVGVMGKLTGSQYAERLAQEIVNVLARNTERGFVFRVDLRLRPEGRYGAPSRSLSSYRHYYESWAETWERQALIKARFVAGDPRVGEAFMRMAEEYTYQSYVPAEWVEDIRHNKRRLEQKAALADETHTNVKIGEGGIRDIEFAVQLLQLLVGGQHPSVRTGNTLEALQRLRREGFLTPEEAIILRESYCFLRTVEHRLQILYEQQTQKLPADPRQLELLARRMGFENAAYFRETYDRVRAQVREIFLRVFYGEAGDRVMEQQESPLRDLLSAIDDPRAQELVLQHLEQNGFRDPQAALRLLQIPLMGTDAGLEDADSPPAFTRGAASPAMRHSFLRIAPALITYASRSPSPDDALLGIETLALAVPNRAQLYTAFADSPEVLRRLVELAGASPPTMRALSGHQELLDTLFSEEIIASEPKTREQMLQQLRQRLGLSEELRPGIPRGYPERQAQTIASFIRRERLRITARDVWGEARGADTARDLTHLTEAVLECALQMAQARAIEAHSEWEEVLRSVAIIGMGKLGGWELGYASDADILFVFEHPASVPHAEAYAVTAKMCEEVLQFCRLVHAQDVPLEVDARLRPEGRFGAIVRTVDDYRQYYLTRGETWERQALIKARPIAGNPTVGEAWRQMVEEEVVYARALSKEELESIRHIKRRVENERLKPEHRWRDVKLGYGGMVDIEFTVQTWQLRVGKQHRSVRHTSTLSALHALRMIAMVSPADSRNAAEAYPLWSTVRNALTLRYGMPRDVIPDDEAEQRILARMLGREDHAQMLQEFEHLMREVRGWVERDLFGD
ncbi:Bifunctional glutamine synthetase adenylyltransferase/adenylyl-removing enzyme [bacterium HR16]|nr:Bifunctional glutamine synthetase adenylyltransferase/adenylyl-removing enzyme [bacterium HR16]